MTNTTVMKATLFAKDLARVAEFYSDALGMTLGRADKHHAVLQRCGFVLVVHQVPPQIAAGIEIAEPVVERSDCALRLEYVVDDVEASRRIASSQGGYISEDPPQWAEPGMNFYLGHDPEGNVFGVSQDE